MLNEKSTSKSQQRLMGMVYAYKTGKLDLDDLPKSLANKIKGISDGRKRTTGDKRRKTKGMSDEEARRYASTKHKGLPEKVEERIITKFDIFVNEGIKHLLKPKSEENILNIFNKMSPKEKLKAILNNIYLKKFIDDDELNKILSENDIIKIYNELIGNILTDVSVNDNEIKFKFDNGDEYLMYHKQDCCEEVILDDVVGDMDDLVGEQLIKAEEIHRENPFADEHGSWTFYKFATKNGYVDIVWKGTSNGYYSEKVTLKKIN